MKHPLLFAYQVLTGLSDTCTGLMLIVAPAITLSLMRVHTVTNALPYLAYIGTFVLSVGIACLYGAYLTTRISFAQKLEVVWLLTAITRGCVAVFVVASIVHGTLEPAWTTVAVTDALFSLFQAIGLWKGWLARVA